MHTRRKAAAGAALLGAAALLGPAAARGAAPDATASRVPVTITAASLYADKMVYAGTVSVATAGASVRALELDIDGATFQGLGLALPCVPIQLGGLTGSTTTDGTSTAARITVYATEVSATIGGTTVRMSSTNTSYPPPAAGTVLVTSGTVVSPTMVAVFVTSPSLRAAKVTTSATFCTPKAGATLAGVPLTSLPKPTAPTVSSSPATPANSPDAGVPGPSGGPQPSTAPGGTPSAPSADATTPSAPSSDTAPVAPDPTPTP